MKEKFDYQTLILNAYQIYFSLSTDTKATAERNNLIGDIWMALKPYWKGNYRGKKYDLTIKHKELVAKRGEIDTEEWAELNEVDRERFGLCMDAFKMAGLLPREIPVFEVGVPVDDDGEMILDEVK